MIERRSRREIVGSLALLAISGCLGSDNSPAENSSSEQSTDTGNTTEQERCDLRTRTRQGDAAPVEITAPLNERDEIERACAQEAAVAALDRLDERVETDLGDSEWITAGWSYDGDYAARITVTSTVDRDGTVESCPDSAFDFDEAISQTPRTVTVIAEKSEQKGEQDRHECTHEILLAQETEHLD